MYMHRLISNHAVIQIKIPGSKDLTNCVENRQAGLEPYVLDIITRRRPSHLSIKIKRMADIPYFGFFL